MAPCCLRQATQNALSGVCIARVLQLASSRGEGRANIDHFVKPSALGNASSTPSPASKKDLIRRGGAASFGCLRSEPVTRLIAKEEARGSIALG